MAEPKIGNYSRSHKLTPHLAPVNSIVFSPDGKYMASGGDDGRISILSSPEGTVQTIQSNQDSVVVLNWMKTSQRAQLLLSGGADGTVKLWRQNKSTAFTLIQSMTVMDHPIEDIDVIGTKLAVVGNGGLFFYKVNPHEYHPSTEGAFEPIHTVLDGIIGGRIQSDQGKIRSVRFIGRGGAAVVGMLNRVLLCWDLVTKRRVFRERLETRIGNMEWDEGSRRLAIWNLYDGIDVYEIQATFAVRPIKISLKIERNYVAQIRFLTEDVLVVGSDNAVVQIVSIQNQSVIKKLKQNSKRHLVQAVACCRRTIVETGIVQHVIAGGSSEIDAGGEIRVWNTKGPLFVAKSWWSFASSAFVLMVVALATIHVMAYSRIICEREGDKELTVLCEQTIASSNWVIEASQGLIEGSRRLIEAAFNKAEEWRRDYSAE
ncbi:hypothetical protein D9611_003619 [Ephemerocybe angulata]|uniref:Uncharacterized protein n=1 Tax=Ephemerocybe angulata TaxID=980116 RepID=A0A8H5B6N1_9AGAR|nr:hypothetical protein D9611_003619 [Tulosesus angulatus]